MSPEGAAGSSSQAGWIRGPIIFGGVMLLLFALVLAILYMRAAFYGMDRYQQYSPRLEATVGSLDAIRADVERGTTIQRYAREVAAAYDRVADFARAYRDYSSQASSVLSLLDQVLGDYQFSLEQWRRLIYDGKSPAFTGPLAEGMLRRDSLSPVRANWIKAAKILTRLHAGEPFRGGVSPPGATGLSQE